MTDSTDAWLRSARALVAQWRDVFVQRGLLREFYYADDGDMAVKCMDCDAVKGLPHRGTACRVSFVERFAHELSALLVQVGAEIANMQNDARLKVLHEIHQRWEFADDTEASFDDWLHRQIKAAQEAVSGDEK